MGRLYYQILYAVIRRTLQSLVHVVNVFAVSGLYMVNNNLCRKCSSYRPVGICLLNGVFNSLDIRRTAVIKGSAEADYQNFIFSDIILIAGIILGSIAGISAKVIRICILPFNHFLLGVCQGIPSRLCRRTLVICFLCSFLNINSVNQCRHFVCCLLIGVCIIFFSITFAFLCIFSALRLFCFCRFSASFSLLAYRRRSLFPCASCQRQSAAHDACQ